MSCEDCGLSYREFGIDTTLSNKQWSIIHPEGAEGLLCAGCIVKRASLLPGIIAIRMTLALASDYLDRKETIWNDAEFVDAGYFDWH